MHVEAYANADEVEFRLNGAPVATVLIGTARSYVAEAQVPYQPGTLEVVAYRRGKEVGRSTLQTAGEPTHLCVESDRTELRANAQRLAYIDISLLDDHGVLNPIRDRTITIEIDGPAVLEGFGTGAPATEESFLDNSSTSYNGRALAVLRSSGQVGQVTVTARAEGMPPAVLQIGVLPDRADDDLGTEPVCFS
jgi:beta-galactosidase